MHFLGLEVGKFCGADGVDDWRQEKWISEIEKNQVQGYIFSKKNFHHPNNIPRIIFIIFYSPFPFFSFHHSLFQNLFKLKIYTPAQVFVFVHEVFRNVICSNYMKFFEVALLILDECHHAVGKHPYSMIMDQYARAKNEFKHQVPKVRNIYVSVWQAVK